MTCFKAEKEKLRAIYEQFDINAHEYKKDAACSDNRKRVNIR